MAGQRELIFDEDKSPDYVAQVVAHINSGDYMKARIIIDKVKDSNTQLNVRRTVAAKTGIYL